MNQDVAVIKGVGIILMVLGHAIAIYNDYSVLYNFIYMFHMPLFFFCTGYFIKDKYVLNIDGLVVFITKKVKSVWVKYVVWSLLLILLHNYLVNLYFYSPEYSSSFGSYWDTEHIFTCAKNALLLKYNSDPLLGGFWFLNVLFYSSIISVLTIYVLRKIFFFFDEDKTNNSLMIYLLSFISLFIISILWSFFITRDIPFVSINQRHFFCAAYMVSGKIFYEIQNKVSLPKYFPFCGLAILGISSCLGFKTDATFYMKDSGGGHSY